MRSAPVGVLLAILVLLAPSAAGAATPQKLVYHSANAPDGLWRINADGSGSPQSFIAGASWPQYSAHASKLLYVVGGDAVCSASVGPGQIVVANADGSDPVTVGSGCEPRISPDGTKVVYLVVSQNSAQLWVVSVSDPSGAQQLLIPEPTCVKQVNDANPNYPDAEFGDTMPGNLVCDQPEIADWVGNGKIAFGSFDIGVWEVPATGGTPQPLITSGGAAVQDSNWFQGLALSPDQNTIAGHYSPFGSGSAGIATLPASGGTPQLLLTDPTSPQFDSYGFPQWSPDGTRLALTHFDGQGVDHIAVMSSSGGSATDVNASDSTAQFATFAPPSAELLSIGDAPSVNEPDSGSVNATFTISLSQASGSNVSVQYATSDGTATTANNDYTATSGTATITAGQTSTQVTVPVDAGSGQSTTPTKTFTVSLSNAGGATIDPAFATATGTIALPEIHGQVATTGNPPVGAAGVQITLTGTAGTGQSVSRTTTTDGSGNYSLSVDPGSYRVGPVPAAGQPTHEFGPGQCDGTSTQDSSGLSSCQITLTSGASKLASFTSDQHISGILTDPNGHPVPGVEVDVTGTDIQGNPVDKQAFSDIDGNYQVTLAPGNYTVAPVQPADPSQGRYVPSTCSGTTQTAVCVITLNRGDQATASFKLLKLVVNSTAIDADPQASLGQGVCDTTPTESSQTCTLPAAIEVANKLGGGTIAFNIPGAGEPTITMDANSENPEVKAPVTIDGTTQPGSHQVTLTTTTGRTATFTFTGINLTAAGETVRGMNIYGFGIDLALEQDDTVDQNHLATTSTAGHFTERPVEEDDAGGHNVIRGNTIGGAQHPDINGTVFRLPATGDTVGGSQPGQGNAFIEGYVFMEPGAGDPPNPGGDVIQGNSFTSVDLRLGDNATFGGPTAEPGTGPGNDITQSFYGVGLGDHDVVQGNRIHGNYPVGINAENNDTIGGASPQMGNLIEDNGEKMSTDTANGGIAIGQPPATATHRAHSGNVIEHNTIINNFGDGGVAVYEGAGNHIFDNVITGNPVQINLGGGAYRYNTLSAGSGGPNHDQPYPELLDTNVHARTVTLTARLSIGVTRGRQRLTIDAYGQAAACEPESVQPGEADKWLGSTQVRTTPLGDANFTIALPLAAAQDIQGAFTQSPAFALTATASDGSTSELSPCLTLAHRAPSFTGRGVTPTETALTVTSGATPTADTERAVVGETKRRQPNRAHLRLTLFCPPITTRRCTGAFTLTTTLRHGTLTTRRRFKLAPGQVSAVQLAIRPIELTALERTHRLHAMLHIAAQDGARHPHHKRTTARLTIRIGR